MLCGTFGCTLPDSHAGLQEVPAPARARERRPTAKARDDSDSDEELSAAVVVTASRSTCIMNPMNHHESLTPQG
jgi:hypothetical protein